MPWLVQIMYGVTVHVCVSVPLKSLLRMLSLPHGLVLVVLMYTRYTIGTCPCCLTAGAVASKKGTESNV